MATSRYARAAVKRIDPILVVLFLVFATCAACCQSERSSADYQGNSSNPPQIPAKHTPKSLPDAPLVNEAFSSLTFGTFGTNTVTADTQPTVVAAYGVVPATLSSSFFDKYLYPSLRKRNLRYRPSSGGSFVDRVTSAASRLFITRDEFGNEKLNDSYLFGVVTSVVVQTAYSPYWTRSTSGAFGNFGSTIGSDAGMNVLHEFEPGILQMVNGHTPKFVSTIKDRIVQKPSPNKIFCMPAR
jgi:hypothetical protein